MNTPKKTNDKQPAEVTKIWIDSEHYIEVDSKGRCSGYCNEGALGYVIQVRSDVNLNEKLALKIPRLLGETHRENAYITEITENEVKAVLIINSKPKRHLLVNRSPNDGPLRGEINSIDISNAVTFVHFQRGKKPLLCQVALKENSVVKHPKDSPFPIEDVQYLDGLLKSVQDQSSKRLSKAVFVEQKTPLIEVANDGKTDKEPNKIEPQKNSAKQQPNKEQKQNKQFAVYDLTNAYGSEAIGETWALGLPSLLFPWADGTLQEAINRNIKAIWNFGDHIEFLKSMCTGVQELHEEGFIHADLRPANIIFTREGKRPGHYYVGDYGGYANSKPTPPQKNSIEISRGPVVAGERSSPFYAPERSLGKERETADRVVFLPTPDGKIIYVVLGWSKDLIDDNGKPKVTLTEVESRDKAKVDHEFKSKDSRLRAGDRVQIRDYIFELDGEENFIEHWQILKCKLPYWQIFHGRVLVACYIDSNLEPWLPIPRTTELLQWSAATDLYSLGALGLYTLFYDGKRIDEQYSEEQTNHRDQANIDDSTAEIENQFREMIDDLSNPTTFQTVWPLLESIRRYLEGIEQVDVNKFGETTIDSPDEEGEKPVSLKEEVIDVVERIILVVPGTEFLVKALGNNAAYFIFYVHFVLCCLHRQNDLKQDTNEKDVDTKLIKTDVPKEFVTPYCLNRCEQPKSPKGAIDNAIARLNQLQKFHDNGFFAPLTMPERDGSLDERLPNPQVHLELRKKRSELQNTRSELQKERDKLNYFKQKAEETYKQVYEEIYKVIPQEYKLSDIPRLAPKVLLASQTVDHIGQIMDTKLKPIIEDNT